MRLINLKQLNSTSQLGLNTLNTRFRGLLAENEDFEQKHVSKNIYFTKLLPQDVPCDRCVVKLTLPHTYRRVLHVVGVW